MVRVGRDRADSRSGADAMRLVVADDEGLIREALTALFELETDIEVVGHAGNGRQAVAITLEAKPDVVVLDLEMPGMDGIEAAKAITAQCDVAIIIVTRHARPATLRRALQVGVRGFVPKTIPAERLIGALRDVHAGGRYIDPEIAASALTEERCPLTRRELELLSLSSSGVPVSEVALAAHLSEGTVRNYLSSAMIKLDARTRHEAVHRAWQEGWI
jgi:two-component system response regulator DesR